MTSILKSGKLREPVQWYVFDCSKCQCEFITNDYKRESDCRNDSYLVAVCPECKSHVTMDYSQ